MYKQHNFIEPININNKFQANLIEVITIQNIKEWIKLTKYIVNIHRCRISLSK